MAQADVSLYQPAPKHFHVVVEISEKEAIHLLDAGKTEMLWLTLKDVLFELRAYRRIGYKLSFTSYK
jgi:hypothetical protein